MIFVDTPADVPLVVIDGVYSDAELALVWKELSFLTAPNRLQSADKTSTAATENGELKKTATGVFLDSFYTDRASSDILQINRKLFAPEIQQHAVSKSIFYRMLGSVNNDYTLVNYYENSQEYKAHHDRSVFTAVTIFCQEPLQFTGGDLVFSDFNYAVAPKNNRMVLFPGAFIHAVTPVATDKDHPPYSGCGRYSVTQLLYSK